jgi:hypothetical protein
VGLGIWGANRIAASTKVKWVSASTTPTFRPNKIDVAQIARTSKQETIMTTAIKYLAPWLAVVAFGGAIAFAPIANADTDPNTPYGTDPMSPAIFGYHAANSPQFDVPF